jgi:hypothetical protein
VIARDFLLQSAHAHGVGQGPTLVIVRSTTGHTFGGYAHAPWTNANLSAREVLAFDERRVFARDSNRMKQGASPPPGAVSFLFLVENPHNDAPTCFECENNQLAIHCDATHGPCFGGDARGGSCDICINPGGDAAQSSTCFPCSYTDTLGRGSTTFTQPPQQQQQQQRRGQHQHWQPPQQQRQYQNFTVEDYEVWAVT